MSDDSHITGIIDYPLILRKDGPPAHLWLPRDLTAKEAERIMKFLEALVDDPPPIG